MATCIVSRAMQLDGAAALSGILLAAGIAAYLVLAAVYAGRLAINRAGVRADAADPGRAFGFFTLAAGSNVLAARLAADDHLAAAAVLLVIGGVSWAGLGYLLPPLLAGRGLGGASGSWFLWPVATQSDPNADAREIASRPVAAGEMEAYAVSRLVNSAKNDGPECIVPSQGFDT